MAEIPVKIIVLTTEAVQTSETFVNSYQSIHRYNPEDSHLHSNRSENLMPYLKYQYFMRVCNFAVCLTDRSIRLLTIAQKTTSVRIHMIGRKSHLRHYSSRSTCAWTHFTSYVPSYKLKCDCLVVFTVVNQWLWSVLYTIDNTNSNVHAYLFPTKRKNSTVRNT
jgi:hypothetical protein